MGLLGHKEVPFLTFWELYTAFHSGWGTPYCIPTNSAPAFPFHHILSNTCCWMTYWWQPFWPVWGQMEFIFIVHPNLWKKYIYIDKANSKKLMPYIQDTCKLKISSFLHYKLKVTFKKCHLILKNILTITSIPHPF